jgi:dynein heavy chain 2
VDSLRRALQGIAYEYTARSLFKADRLMFALHVVRGMHPDMFLDGEWDFLAGLLVEAGEEGAGRAPSWLEPERQPDTGKLLAAFPQLAGALQLEDGGAWQAFMKAETPERDFPVQVVRLVDSMDYPALRLGRG